MQRLARSEHREWSRENKDERKKREKDGLLRTESQGLAHRERRHVHIGFRAQTHQTCKRGTLEGRRAIDKNVATHFSTLGKKKEA
jgi:hypothetical protein